ncbi:MAG: copper transporter [Gaiellaceae bacterium]
MFDLRYHVASLAAVFLALLIGILVGVGIADRGYVDKAQRGLLEQRISKLQSDLSASRKNADSLKAQQRATEAFVTDTYPELMANRLRGKSVALLFLGPLDTHIQTSLEQALADSGARGWVRVRALKLPLDVPQVDKSLAGDPKLARYVGDARLPALGKKLAEELAAGGKAPLWTNLAEQIVAERTGSEQRPADGVIVVRTAGKQYDGTAAFLRGLYSGLIAAPVPVVGVETADASQSAVQAFQRNGISSVDDADQPIGRFALALLLSGAKSGHYGIKSSAKDGVLPPLETATRG